MLLKKLSLAFAAAALIVSCKTKAVLKDFPPPDVDLCAMGSENGNIFIDCEPWFYEGRTGYEVDPAKAAKMKYFMIAPNHYRALQKYIEKLEAEIGAAP